MKKSANKFPMSKDWTPKERLSLIVRITGKYMTAMQPMPLEDVDAVFMIARMTSGFLETNRANFSEWVEMPELDK